MTKNLLIFVDGLPYHYLNRTRYLKAYPHKRSISPGMGFSVNIKPELYSGLSPDEVGYFCEYGVRDGAPSEWQKPLSLLHFIRRWPRLDRLVHKMFIKLGFEVLNIPFAHVKHFTKTHTMSIYSSDYPFPSLFSETPTHYIAAEKMQRGGVSRDRRVFQLAESQLSKPDNLHLSLIGLDQAGHSFGLGTPAYDRKLAQMENWIEGLVKKARQINPDCNVVIFSDHGMANVTGAVSLELEKYLGPSNPDTYLYFIDSVMLRIWIYRSSLYPRTMRLLEDFGHGTILSQTNRNRYGVTAPYCGDIIFVLDEGYIFSPNYFGLKQPRAMHGYLPQLESQQAVLLTQGPGIKREHLNQIQSTRDIHHFLVELCQD